MANVLTIFLLVSTVVTGIIWIFYYIQKIKNYFLKSKEIKNNYISLENKYLFNYQIRFLKTLASFFPIFLTIFIVRSFVYEPFQIPSGSMMPTLLIGDLIIVEKFTYGIKEPITHKTLIKTGYPQRGDIAVFRHPIDYKTNYIKRIIGLPGDKIIYDIRKKHIHICPNYIYTKHCTNPLTIHYSKPKLSNFTQKVYFSNEIDNSIKNNKIYHLLYCNVVEEKIDAIKHNILLLNNIYSSTKDYFHQKNMHQLTWIVPKRKYFMMGDNRDNSFDSRYWGFVPEENLVGKAVKIWMSFNKNENEWPTGIRINRIGNIY